MIGLLLPRSRLRRAIAAVVLLLLFAALFEAALVARIATGFAAKVICSGVFVAGRDADAVRREDLAFLPFLRVTIDRDARSATVSIGPIAQRAVARAGLGSALVADRQDDAVRALTGPTDTADVALAALPWPAGDAEPPGAPPAGLDSARLSAALDRAFAEAPGKHERRTRAVIVVQRDRIVAERYAPGFDLRTPQLGWSMSKTVLNALLGIRAREGKLSTATASLLPEWTSAGDARASITVGDMLHMSSGLAFDERYFSPHADAVRMLFDSADAASFAADRALSSAPGTVWSYSSGTSNILARVLARTFAGDDAAYRSFPRDALFGPLGMRSAVLEADAGGTFVASSFTWATPRDWARLGLLYLHDGVWTRPGAPPARILPEGWVAWTRAPAPAAPRGRYGAHVWCNAGTGGDPSDRPMPRVPADLFYMAGFEDQTVTIVPSRDAVIVRMGLTTDPAQWDLEEFLRDVLEALP